MIRGSVWRTFRNRQPASESAMSPNNMFRFSDHQHEPLVLPIGEVQQRAETTIGQRLVVADGSQLSDSAVQVGGVLLARRLSCQIGQTLQPEFPGGGDLVALLREDDREKARR